MMNLNYLSERDMEVLVNLNLFVYGPNEDTAEPNIRFVTPEIPGYDWDEVDEYWKPRWIIQDQVTN